MGICDGRMYHSFIQTKKKKKKDSSGQMTIQTCDVESNITSENFQAIC